VGGQIFLIRDGKLVEMNEQQYDSEDLLQALLEDYPQLMAGNQIDSVNPRQWLLISRETPVPSEESGSGRWSLDHLFLDQDGIPTLVEVKRSSDTRIRREVIGQMLDYAANGVVYWPIEIIRQMFEQRCYDRGEEPEEVLAQAFDNEVDPDRYWEDVRTNLRAGKVRLLFIADQIPPELQRIVEFLNEQMNPAEVLAVEIKQYVGEGRQTLVPRIIGQTAEAITTKTGGRKPPRQWDEQSFLDDLREKAGGHLVPLAKKILDWIADRGLIGAWGKGASQGTCYAQVVVGDKRCRVLGLFSHGKLEFEFRHIGPEVKRELLDRLNAIEGFDIPEERLNSWTFLSFEPLLDDTKLKQFFEVADWLVEKLKT
jgi:hypothetical protein